MAIKRRKFVQSLFIAPAAPAVLGGQQETPKQQPVPQPNTPARQVPRQPQSIPKLQVTSLDLAADTDQRFFTAEQFATLQKLGGVLVPPLKGKPGALDAFAPEFLDFLIGVSPADRQNLYRNGLDHLNAQAREKYSKSFSELERDQADAILRPLLVARPWPEDLPSDPIQNFVAQAHQDLRTATMNSRQWANGSTTTTGRPARGFFTGSGFYWHPVDPVNEG
jgi:hypothetical protein